MADADTISSMMEEKRVFPPTDKFCDNARVKSFEEYRKLYDESIKDPEKFWEKIAREELDWFNDEWDSVFEWDRENAKFSWFKGGKINVSYQCLDRHLKTWRKNKAALIWQGEPEDDVRTYTYAELYHEVCKFANVLKNLGVKKGDRVAVYLPMIPELAITLLSCARIGAIHSVVFGGFSSDALRDRINDSECKLLVTADGYYRNGKNITAKQNADSALDGSPSVKKAVVVRRLGVDVSMKNGRDVWWHEEMEKVNGRCEAEELDAEDPLFILYTSGSTGKPKGVMHTNAGYILYTQTTFKYIFDHREEDTYWCTADIGWITGHSYIVYGPLASGATSIMFEGVPMYPGPDRWWHMVEKFKITTFYMAPTAIRALMAEGLDHVNKHDLSTLRLLGSVGEPINPEAWMWYYNNVGRKKCPIVDTWWQTETGGILITPMPGATTLKPGSATFPFFGIEPAIIREDGTEADQNEGGYLVIRKPWPGLMRGVYNQPERFKETYWSQYPGNYFSGDGARRDSDGYFWLMGRVDDVIKVSGHRIGTAEVESALVAHPKVAEAAVVPMPHEIKGEAIYAFVRLNSGENGNDELVKELVTYVRSHLGPIARPDKIQFAKDLPKTRSGKIMRRILKKIAANQIDQVGDTSTLADPSVVDAIVAERL